MDRYTKRLFKLTLVLTFCSYLNAQTAKTSIAELYASLKSNDPAIRSQAQADAVKVLEENLPHLEDESAVIAAGLHDDDPYIRLQSSAILALVAKAVPGHSGLLQNCLPDLEMAVTDENPRIRINALSALAYTEGGTPISATPSLLKALHMPDADTKAFSIMALLKLHELPSEVSREIAVSIHQANDSITKNKMLRAIYTVGPVPPLVADSAFSLTTDNDADVKLLAIQTVARMYADKAVAESKLQDIAQANAAPSAAGKEAKRQIDQLKPLSK